MTRERARALWDEFKWWAVVVLVPLMVWAFTAYDAAKVDTHAFNTYVNRELAKDALRDLRDSARQEGIARQLKYLSCRQDFSRRECLRPDR